MSCYDRILIFLILHRIVPIQHVRWTMVSRFCRRAANLYSVLATTNLDVHMNEIEQDGKVDVHVAL
jgi:hypothetical protein